MPATQWSDADTARAMQAWKDYQDSHDVSDRLGQTVGIDPVSGRVWFGERAGDVTQSAHADGVFTPILCIRVGLDYYQRKGRGRCYRVE